MGKLKGQCLCGDVQFSGEGPLINMSACHCGMCRTWCGGGPYLGAHFKSGVKIEKQVGLKWWASSEIGERGFCSTCGTNMFWRLKNETADYAFSPSLLSDDKGYAIGEHIFIDDKPDYYDFSDTAPRKTGAQVIAEWQAKG